MAKKNLFSEQSKEYAAFRPTYPDDLYSFIFSHLKERKSAWDCATGNGQVARHLADHFDAVFATDISEEQLRHAFKAGNIFYSHMPAEETTFGHHQFDLVTIAQALHWLDVTAFYREILRTTKPEGIVAAWGYSLPTFEPFVDEMLLDFYHNQAGPYWDPARTLVENHYRDIAFPFERIASPEFQIEVHWTAAAFIGYIRSWSATQSLIRHQGSDQLERLHERLAVYWKPGEVKIGIFPIFMKLGKIPA